MTDHTWNINFIIYNVLRFFLLSAAVLVQITIDIFLHYPCLFQLTFFSIFVSAFFAFVVFKEFMNFTHLFTILTLISASIFLTILWPCLHCPISGQYLFLIQLCLFCLLLVKDYHVCICVHVSWKFSLLNYSDLTLMYSIFQRHCIRIQICDLSNLKTS